MGRDNARTPMQWDAGPQAGFSSGEPWIEVNPNHVTINAAQQRDDPDSIFHHYRRVIALRRAEPVVARGDFTMLLADHPSVYAFTRSLDGVTLLVLASFADHEVEVAVPPSPQDPTRAWARDAALLPTHPGGPVWPAPDRVVLRPWESVVLRQEA